MCLALSVCAVSQRFKQSDLRALWCCRVSCLLSIPGLHIAEHWCACNSYIWHTRTGVARTRGRVYKNMESTGRYYSQGIRDYLGGPCIRTAGISPSI